MKPFRVWGKRAAAIALLLSLATNAMALSGLPGHPIDSDEPPPPPKANYVGDPSDSGGGIVKQTDPGLEQMILVGISALITAKLQVTVYFVVSNHGAQIVRASRGARRR